jgi:hypothetical protein
MTMSAENTNSITLRFNKKWAWVAAGIVAVGIAGLNKEQQVPMGSRPGWNAAVPGYGARPGWNGPAQGYGGRPGFAPSGDGQGAELGWNCPAMGGGMAAPQMGAYTPTAAGAGYGGAEVPTSGDSVSDRINNNFSDYMRGQQRVVSEYDGQTYTVDGNADPNQMWNTQDGVSNFSAATPGSTSAGYAEVAPSGATTVDTSTATPVDTSSSAGSE